MSEELKPCPFCGGEPTEDRIEPHKHHIVGFPDYPGAWCIECVPCEFRRFSHESREEAVAAWNHRAGPSDAAQAPYAYEIGSRDRTQMLVYPAYLERQATEEERALPRLALYAAPVPPAAAAPSGYSKGTDQVWFANRNKTCQETTPAECNNCQSDSPYALCSRPAQPEVCSMCEQQYDPACEECHTGSTDAAQPDERAAFEAWAQENAYDLARSDANERDYWYGSTAIAWMAWQAARAAVPQAGPTLTDAQRATIFDAARSLTIRADELKESNTLIDGTWCDDEEKAQYDAEVALISRLRAMLAAHPTEQRMGDTPNQTLYVWFAENEGAQRKGEHYIRSWTADAAQVPHLQTSIGRPPIVYTADRAD